MPPLARRRQQAEVRRVALLEVALNVLADDGLAEFTLARVAERAGVRSSLLIHYFGSRQDLLVEALGEVVAHYRQVFVQARESRTPQTFLPVLLDLLFDPTGEMRRFERAVSDALGAAYGDDLRLRRFMRVFYEGLEAFIVRVLVEAYPEAPEAAVRRTAYQFLCLAEAHRTMLRLGFDPSRTEDLYRIARRTLEALGALRAREPDGRRLLLYQDRPVTDA